MIASLVADALRSRGLPILHYIKMGERDFLHNELTQAGFVDIFIFAFYSFVQREILWNQPPTSTVTISISNLSNPGSMDVLVDLFIAVAPYDKNDAFEL